MLKCFDKSTKAIGYLNRRIVLHHSTRSCVIVGMLNLKIGHRSRLYSFDWKMNTTEKILNLAISLDNLSLSLDSFFVCVIYVYFH